MKTLLLAIILSLASCAPYQKGEYVIKTEGGAEYKATAVYVIDEEEKIKYKDASGTHTYQGSFELYEYGEE